MSVVFTGYEVLLRVEGAARLLGTRPVEGVGAAVQATSNGGAFTLAACTPTASSVDGVC